MFDAGSRTGTPSRRFPQCCAIAEGPTRAILTGERTALNLLGRLSGVATLTRRYVDAVEGSGAVRPRHAQDDAWTARAREARGALRRRRRTTGSGLDDAILVKDNHLRLAGGIAAAVERASRRRRGLPIEVEARPSSEVREALAAGADRILLDNMRLDDAPRRRSALVAGRGRSRPPAASRSRPSAPIAETGVDFISIGALTHSARALDVSLEVLP